MSKDFKDIDFSFISIPSMPKDLEKIVESTANFSKMSDLFSKETIEVLGKISESRASIKPLMTPEAIELRKEVFSSLESLKRTPFSNLDSIPNFSNLRQENLRVQVLRLRKSLNSALKSSETLTNPNSIEVAKKLRNLSQSLRPSLKEISQFSNPVSLNSKIEFDFSLTQNQLEMFSRLISAAYASYNDSSETRKKFEEGIQIFRDYEVNRTLPQLEFAQFETDQEAVQVEPSQNEILQAVVEEPKDIIQKIQNSKLFRLITIFGICVSFLNGTAIIANNLKDFYVWFSNQIAQGFNQDGNLSHESIDFSGMASKRDSHQESDED